MFLIRPDIKSDIMVGNVYYPPIDLHLIFEKLSLMNSIFLLPTVCSLQYSSVK